MIESNLGCYRQNRGFLELEPCVGLCFHLSFLSVETGEVQNDDDSV